MDEREFKGKWTDLLVRVKLGNHSFWRLRDSVVESIVDLGRHAFELVEDRRVVRRRLDGPVEL